MTEPTSPSNVRPGARRLVLGLAFAATFAAGGLVVPAASALAMQAAMEHGMGGHEGMGMGMHGDMHAQLHAHVQRMLAEVDATPEQREKIEAILKTAFHAIAPVHHSLADSHRDLHRILTAPVIDRAALEELRASLMAEVDQASRTAVNALADAAEVLTPEQRAKLAAMHHPEAHGQHHG
jgi:Spy/CpxP family protein refolding chaperone